MLHVAKMAGLVAYYNQVPRFRTITTNKVIQPVGGANPVDSDEVLLPNVRGQVQIMVISGDNSYVSGFDLKGGFGDFPQDWTQDWYPNAGTEIGGTISVPVKNTIVLTTDVADAGGREYTFVFEPVQSFGPTIRQNSVNVIGNNNLTVILKKQVVVQGW